jgi:hypothetical protein
MGSAKSFIGTVYAALLDASKNKVGGYRRIGNVYPLSVQVATEQKKQTSRMRESAGQTKDSKTTITDTTGSMTVRDWDAKNLAWALAGEESELTGEAGTATAEAIVLIEGEWVKVAHGNISDVVFATGVLGVDFEVNVAVGLIKLLKADVLTAGATTVTYEYAAQSGYKVEIGTRAQTRIAILIDGEDEFSGEAMTVELDSVVLASNAEINFISDPGTEYEELPFSLTFETLDGKSSPGRVNGISL